MPNYVPTTRVKRGVTENASSLLMLSKEGTVWNPHRVSIFFVSKHGDTPSSPYELVRKGVGQRL